MGCSSSISVQGAGVAESGPELVVVGGKSYSEADSHVADQVTTIDIYNLGRNKTRRSLDMPKAKVHGVLEQLTHGFAAACSPTSPVLYITGGFYTNVSSATSNVWSIHLSGQKGCYEKLPDMPMPLSRHRMCHATLGGREYLFVVGDDNKCFRYSLDEKTWYQIPTLPVKIRNIDAVLCINQCLYICGNGYLLLHHLREIHGDGHCNWFINQESAFPRGNVSALDQRIVIHKYDYKDNFIYLYDTWDDSLQEFSSVHESDIMARSGMTSLSPDIMYFAGGFDEVLKKSSNAVVEYNMKLKRAVIACFLDAPREDHLMFINKFVCK